MAQEPNGNAPTGPPWASVPAQAMIRELTAQIAAQAQEMAAMSIYIEQLHEALRVASAPVPAEDTGPPA